MTEGASLFALGDCANLLHCTEISKQNSQKMKLRGIVPNFYIHVSVRFIYSHDMYAHML
jgi:hypothetical protein